MAQLVLGVAGAAVGSLFGVPQIGWAIGSALGGSLAASQQKVSGPRLSDLKVTSTDYGQPIPWVRGTPRIAGQIWWASDRREIASSESAGKGGGPTVTSYTYEIDCIVGLTDGEIGWISRIWWNGKLVYNVISDADDGSIDASLTTEYWRRMTVMTGADTQMPDPVYEAAVGADLAPGYRGRGAVLFEGLQLGNSGQLPNLTFEIALGSEAMGETVLLMQFDGNIVDEIGHPFNSGGSILFGAGKFSGALNVNGDPPGGGGPNVVVSALPSDDWDLLYQSFTISTWVMFNGTTTPGSTLTFVGVFNDAVLPEQEFMITFYNNRFEASYPVGSGSVGTAFINYTVTAADYGKWFYLEFASDGSKYYFSLDGEMISGSVPAYVRSHGPKKVFIGNNRAPSVGLYGMIDGVRIVRGKAIHTASFTRPTAPPGLTDRIAFTTPLPLLQDVVEALCERANMGGGMIDASALATITKPVRALAVSQVGPTRQVLEQLQTAYFFEAALSDKIYFRPRASEPVDTIPFSMLAAGRDDADAQPLAMTVSSDLEVPAQVALQYSNVSDDYQAGTEYSDRLLSGQASLNTVQLALGFTPAEAKGIADAIVNDGIASLVNTNLSLPLAYAKLEPSDVVLVIDEDGLTSYRLRLGRKDDEAGVLKFAAVVDDPTVVVSAEITDESYAPSGTVTALAGTVLNALDIPLLRDADNGPGYYVAARGDSSSWPGATVLGSADDVDYASVATVAESAVQGTCTTTLGAWTGGLVMDELNSVTVSLAHGELSSTTREALLTSADSNTMLIGSEVIRFVTATLQSSAPNVYKLTRLLRGLRGTEWAMAGHAASERAVLLRMQGLRRVAQQSGDSGKLLYLKGVTLGRSASDATAIEFTPEPISQKPFSVVDLRVLAVGSAASLTWKRRTRLSTRLVGAAGISAPLGESVESYLVEMRTSLGALVSSQLVTGQSASITSASISKTLALPLFTAYLSGSVLYGNVDTTDEDARTGRLVSRTGYLVAMDYASGAVLEQSFQFGGRVSEAVFDGAGNAYCATVIVDQAVGYIQAATLKRVALSNLSAAAATWDAPPYPISPAYPDHIYSVAFDGTHAWTMGCRTGTLRKHDGTTLAVVASTVIETPAFSGSYYLAAAGGFIYASGTAGGFGVSKVDPTGSPTVIWTTMCASATATVKLVGAVLFVSLTNDGVAALDPDTGAILFQYTDGQPGNMAEYDGQLVYRPLIANGNLNRPFRFLSGTTGAIVTEMFVPGARYPTGQVGTNLLAAGLAANGMVDVGYEYDLGSDLTGNVVTVSQISGDSIQGYPASITL